MSSSSGSGCSVERLERAVQVDVVGAAPVPARWPARRAPRRAVTSRRGRGTASRRGDLPGRAQHLAVGRLGRRQVATAQAGPLVGPRRAAAGPRAARPPCRGRRRSTSSDQRRPRRPAARTARLPRRAAWACAAAARSPAPADRPGPPQRRVGGDRSSTGAAAPGPSRKWSSQISPQHRLRGGLDASRRGRSARTAPAASRRAPPPCTPRSARRRRQLVGSSSQPRGDQREVDGAAHAAALPERPGARGWPG